MDIYDSLPELILQLERVKAMSGRAVELLARDVIDDGEELMDAYLEEMPEIYRIVTNILCVLQEGL